MRKLRPRAGVSPVVATIILIAIFIAVVSAALGFTQTELTSYYAQSDLNQAQSFASNLAQAVNSVAFTFGRSLSIGYGFKYATIAYIPNVLVYTITVTAADNTYTFQIYTGILLVAISAHFYSLGQNYEQTIYPQKYTRLVSLGGAGSYSLAYSKEYFTSGQPYIYTVIAPIPLAINNTITLQAGSTQKTQYVTKIYLAQLVPGNQQEQPPQSCTQITPPKIGVVTYNVTTGYISTQGAGYASCTIANVESITVSASSASQLYPTSFFIFPSLQETIHPPSQGGEWQLQLYVGSVELGGG
ncbi:hypothetical protein B9Q04_00275 [Candidatus Marsarchaeota G2 archaeon BE_D]|jgi:hypothetical protein|uniref:Uncharacterized protein n=4 Tax=Candidatus Marsarchaeota group 2 TaxID=2203771 RepID=A0A2R6CF63_9ARCH|nr:MAG: hypothetical protein B9Q06_00655 [Candidatus Marsarchaeota G2 archaeon ECH_B_2]PSO01258.1 MAG: hypothetical protein B9Q07_00060 [Candidatus Marsarchaeota G2 archaeon ECH_B_3]PSO03392.1 MAG: hypothetical protein B9Q05_00655 [Candidatus Marsarchaeota G2 archaeon ECH_B_1]PSO09460.1 MAG: hypothetical protein B9Q04_00275 [Candidatus Marsarchaeota G2 archaeon BE_D]